MEEWLGSRVLHKITTGAYRKLQPDRRELKQRKKAPERSGHSTLPGLGRRVTFGKSLPGR